MLFILDNQDTKFPKINKTERKKKGTAEMRLRWIREIVEKIEQGIE